MTTRKLTKRFWLGILCGAALTLCAAAPAQAVEPIYTFIPSPPPPPAAVTPPPTGYLNGPCGLAVDSSSRVYVADYYHHTVDVFTAGSSQASLPGYVTQLANVDPLDGPCGLAVDGPNSLYVNNFHRNVSKYGASPSFTPGPIFDSNTPTGVAVDAANNVYVNNRTYISVYDSTGRPVDDGGNPLRIGVGNLRDGYGLAVSQFPGTLGYVYVPDAGTNTVKVYDPLTNKVTPRVEIRDPFGRAFVSLQDSAIAVDKVTGDIYFADNTQPRYTEKPQATIYAYGATHTWRGYLPYQVTSARPPGLAIDNTANPSQGRVYVTSGNTHQAGWYAYAPGSRVTGSPAPSRFSLALNATSGSGAGSIDGDLEGVECSSSCEPEVRSAAEVTLTATPEPGSAFTGWSGAGCTGTGDCTVQMTEARSVSASFEELSGPPAPPAEAQGASASSAAHISASGDTVITQKGNLRVAVSGKLSPKRLPRDRVAPIAVSVGGRITTTDGTLPPQLKTMRIELNHNGKIDYAGLPTCVYSKIQPGSSSRALTNCRPALVGRGSFTANITLAGQEPYPTRGRLLVFNSLRGGKPVLFGHIYSSSPFATSFVIVFRIERLKGGTYGIALNAPLPKAMDAWGSLTGLEMTLSRRYHYKGRSHSYISSGCPAPRGFPGAVFPLARTSFAFEGGTKLSSVFTSTCKVRG
jgi:hypothetical protein